MPKISAYPTKGTPTTSDFAIIADAADSDATKKATIGTLFTAASLAASTPASAAATGTAGEWQYDTNYIYVCVATNTWKRVGISTW